MSQVENWKIETAWPPSANHTWRKTRGGRIYLATEARTFRADVMSRVAAARSRGDLPRRSFARRLRVDMELTPPDRRRRDIDNVHKALFDALTRAGVWTDDQLVKKESTEFHEPDGRGGRVALTITELGDD